MSTKKIMLLNAGLVMALAGIDLLAKQWVSHNIELYESRNIFGDILILKPRLNGGIILGLFSDTISPLFVIASKLLIISGLIYFYFLIPEIVDPGYYIRLGIVFMLGGLSGNTVDRIADNVVMDFIVINIGGSSRIIFNIADGCMLSGVVLLVSGILFFANINR
ncbi:hypothetical protein GF337_19660 [candidate division KSB1 bacterium]|nr:hypothetical protein [candidate division KSB1 bacterium]